MWCLTRNHDGEMRNDSSHIKGPKTILNRSVATFLKFQPTVHKPNLIKAGWKTQKLKSFTIGRLWLVGWGSQKIPIAISNSFYVVLFPMLPHNKVYPNRTKFAQKNAIDPGTFCSLFGSGILKIIFGVNLIRGLVPLGKWVNLLKYSQGPGENRKSCFSVKIKKSN